MSDRRQRHDSVVVAGETSDGSDGTRTRGLRRDRSEREDAESGPKPAFSSGMVHLPPQLP